MPRWLPVPYRNLGPWYTVGNLFQKRAWNDPNSWKCKEKHDPEPGRVNKSAPVPDITNVLWGPTRELSMAPNWNVPCLPFVRKSLVYWSYHRCLNFLTACYCLLPVCSPVVKVFPPSCPLPLLSQALLHAAVWQYPLWILVHKLLGQWEFYHSSGHCKS